jgi:hypothetical protein
VPDDVADGAAETLAAMDALDEAPVYLDHPEELNEAGAGDVLR